MREEMDVRLQDLAIEEVRELLLEAGVEATYEQAAVLSAFVASIGDLDEALALLEEMTAPAASDSIERRREAA